MVGDLPKSIVDSETDKPELPDERFENAAQVRDLCQLMIQADNRGRAWMRERVDALVSGFPTYPKSVTAAKGFGWFPRVNYRESEGLISAQQTPLFDLVTEVDHCIEIELDVKGTTEEKQDWENSIAKNWTWLLFKRWRTSFNYHLPLSQREMLVHGMGAHVWPQKNRWIPRTPRSGQILFPEGCPLDFQQDGKYFMLRDFVPGEDVYGFIRNEKAARTRGWMVDNVWKTLVKAGKQNQRVQNFGVEELQRKARRGDIGYWNTSQTGLWINWMFVKEYDGGISLYAVEENLSSGNKDGGYLFKKRFMWDQDDGWPLVLWPYDIGTGDIHSVRGLGWRTKDFFELSNRVNNAMVAQVLISAFPMFRQTQNNLDPDKIKLMRGGALNISPYGLEPMQWGMPPLNNSGLALSKHLRDTLNNNNQSMTGAAPEPKDRETKYSFMLRSQDSASVSNGQQSLYESNYQQFQEKMYRLAINTPKGDEPYKKMVEEFREKCREDGVPEEALKERAIGQIREVTATGAGSASIRLQAIDLLINSPVYMNASEDKKIAIERMLVATTLGQVNVDKFARSVTDGDMPNQDDSFAMQESNGLADGGEAIIGTGQNDVRHATNHLQKAAMVAQECQAGQKDPQECLNALQRLLQHAGEHLNRLQGNPLRKAEFQQLSDQWKELAQFMGKLQGQIQSQEGEMPPEQELSEEGQIKMAKVQQDSAIKEQKTNADLQLKFRKAAFTERIQDATTAAKIARDAAVPKKPAA